MKLQEHIVKYHNILEYNSVTLYTLVYETWLSIYLLLPGCFLRAVCLFFAHFSNVVSVEGECIHTRAMSSPFCCFLNRRMQTFNFCVFITPLDSCILSLLWTLVAVLSVCLSVCFSTSRHCQSNGTSARYATVFERKQLQVRVLCSPLSHSLFTSQQLQVRALCSPLSHSLFTSPLTGISLAADVSRVPPCAVSIMTTVVVNGVGTPSRHRVLRVYRAVTVPDIMNRPTWMEDCPFH